MKADQILEQAAQTFRDRQAVYKSNYKQIGTIMKGLFPDGVTLKTEEDHIRFHLFMLMVVKINRYSNNWSTGHQDSIRDACVYASMVEMVDSEIFPAYGPADALRKYQVDIDVDHQTKPVRGRNPYRPGSSEYDFFNNYNMRLGDAGNL